MGRDSKVREASNGPQRRCRCNRPRGCGEGLERAAATGSAVGMGNAATVGGTTTVGDTAAMGDATSEGITAARAVAAATNYHTTKRR